MRSQRITPSTLLEMDHFIFVNWWQTCEKNSDQFFSLMLLSSSCEHSFSHFSDPFFFLPNKLQEAENFPSFPNKQSRYLLLQNQAHSRSRSSYPMICNKKIKLKISAGTFYQHARIHGFSIRQVNRCKESKKATRTMYEIISLPFHRLNYQR